MRYDGTKASPRLGMDGRRGGDIEFIIVMLNGIDCKSREEEKPV